MSLIKYFKKTQIFDIQIINLIMSKQKNNKNTNKQKKINLIILIFNLLNVNSSF